MALRLSVQSTLIIIALTLGFGCSTAKPVKVAGASKCDSKVYRIDEKLPMKRDNIAELGLLEEDVVFKTKDAQYGIVSYEGLDEKLIIGRFKDQRRSLEEIVISRLRSIEPHFHDQSVFEHGRQAYIKLKLDSQVIETEVWLFTASVGVVAYSPVRDYSMLPYKSLLGKVVRITKTNDPEVFEATVLHDLDKGA